LSQSDSKHDSQNLLDELKNYIRQKNPSKLNVYLGLIHRLDRPCSGVMAFAKTSKCASRLSEEFRTRSVEKKYLCIVNGALQGSGQCNNLLLNATTQNKTIVLRNDALETTSYQTRDVSKAELEYTSLLNFEIKKNDGTSSFQQSLLEINLKTGRKHQIRAQLAHIGFTICGDTKYGATQAFKQRDIALHAYFLSFLHPISKVKLLFTCKPNIEVWQKRFGGDVIKVLDDLI
jgi:23S rRNA-/tRNA-specific pseudouridylate synthase